MFDITHISLHGRLRRSLATAMLAGLVASSVLFTARSLAQTPEQLNQIDQLLAATYKPNEPGAVVLIAKDGKPVLRKAYGLADFEKGVPLKPDDVFRIGSVTKPFTALAILLLEEDGKLALSDEITRFFPDYPTQGQKITIEHLLTHTSGVAIYTELPAVRGNPALVTPIDVINAFKTAPMSGAPGAEWVYNNSGYYLLGAVIEKVSGLPYAGFLASRIFTPLGMHNTAFEGKERGAKRVPGYRTEAGKFRLAPDMAPNMTYAAGGLVSTADDLLRWQVAIASHQLLKPATWKRVFTPATLNNGTATEYGYGWSILKLRGQALRTHGGVVAGFQSSVLMLPQQQLSITFLTNQQARQNVARRMGEQIAAMAIGKPFPEHKPITLTEAALTQFEGVYQREGKPARTITRAGAQLRQSAGNSQSLMQPFAEREFFQPDGSFTRYRFEADAAGKVVRMVRIDIGDEEEVYTRISDAPVRAANATSR